MIEAADSGSLKALYVMGENPVYNLPDSSFVKASLGKLDLIVVQDIFMTETAEIADVVLPALGWSEKDGTYTNLERRIQRLRKAIEKDGMEDWRILSEVGKRLGLKMQYESSTAILNEIANVSPLHAGLTYDELEKGMDLWPYKGEPLRRKTGAGTLKPDQRWTPADKGKLYLGIQRHMFLSGTMSKQSTALNSIFEEPYVYMSPSLAKRHGLSDGADAEIKTVKGSLVMKVKTDKGLSDNIVLLTNNFRDSGGLRLIPFAKDPVTKVPCLNGIEVFVRKADR
jgi:predicted molibdopterin-dependent oxidoreductase YjgC